MYKYPDIERLGHEDNKDIFEYPDDNIVIEEKVDGGNGGVWIDDDKIIHFQTRNRDLTTDKDIKTFAVQRASLTEWIKDKELNPDYIYYVEWMARHTINYTSAPGAIGFDIRLKHMANEEGPGLFIGRDMKEQEFKRLNIPCIPLIWAGKVRDLKDKDPMELIGKSAFYDGIMEGIVIKNYSRKSSFENHQLMAKLVTEQFKENNKAVFGSIKMKTSDAMKMCDVYATEARIKKVILKMINEYGKKLEMGLMRDLYKEVVADIFKEENGEIITTYNFIDLREFHNLVAKRCARELQKIIMEQAMEKVNNI